MKLLLEKEIQAENSKFLKPDFSTKTGREFLAFYLQTKFKQLLVYDKKSATPIFKEVKPDFISKFSRRLIDSPDKRILIAITGESASGKTTICKKIKEAISCYEMPIEILSTDNYFNDISALINKFGTFDALRDNGYDVDSPESFQLALLKDDLTELRNGRNIKSPEYLVNGTGISVPKSIPIQSQKVVVVEGMASMYNEVKDVFDITVYVDIDRKIQKQWFLERAKERNQDEDNALKHLDYLKVAAKKYIEPQRHECDIVIDGASALPYFKHFMEYLYRITNNFTV